MTIPGDSIPLVNHPVLRYEGAVDFEPRLRCHRHHSGPRNFSAIPRRPGEESSMVNRTHFAKFLLDKSKIKKDNY
jgi:hypothetical protein